MQKSTINSVAFYLPLLARILFMMKLVCILIFVCCVSVSASVYSQNSRISINAKGVAISEVFKIIEKNTAYKFVYNNYLFPAESRIDVTMKDATVAEILNRLLQPTGFTYQLLSDHLIVITKQQENAQLFTLYGNITTETDQPLPGVTVQVKGNVATATISDSNGAFSLSSITGNETLTVSYIGYYTQEIQLAGQKTLVIKLKAATNTLNEVQVIGYGTTTRRLNTGTVSSLTANDIAAQPVQNPLTALQGRIAGADITPTNGLPGAGVNILIRGQNSINSGTGPLYLIDGVPFNISDGAVPVTNSLNSFGVYAANGGISPFSIINPADIERIDILKDADATAIYGARGGNGVVLITTKKGQAGKTKFDVNFYQGDGKVARFIPMMNIKEYLQLRHDALNNDALTADAANAPDLVSWDTTANENWQKKYLGGTSYLTDAEMSVSGGNATTNFIFGTGYHRETTVYPGDFNDQRFSSRLSLQHQSENRKFSMGLSLNYSYDQSVLPSGDLASSVYNLPPDYPLYNTVGTLYWYGSTLVNPESYIMQSYTGKTNNLLANLQMSYNLLTGLDFKTNLGYNNISLTQNQEMPGVAKNPNAASNTNSAQFANNANSSYIIEPQLSYNKKTRIGKVTLLGGATFQRSLSQANTILADGYSNPDLLSKEAGASSYSLLSDAYTLYKYSSVFGRVNYDRGGKYIFNATIRRDGSSRFGADYRFGTFYSFGGAWVFAEENFLKNNLPFLSFGKLKASYGLTGNDQIQDYQYLTTYRPYTGSYSYQGNSTLSPNGINNPLIRWETNRKLDIGADLGFLKDKLLVTVNYYRNRSDNQLGYIQLAAQSGMNSYVGNIPALLQNSGFEFELNTTNLSSAHLQWKTSVNLTIPKNAILAISPEYYYASEVVLGHQISQEKVFHYVGVDPQTGQTQFSAAAGGLTGSPDYGVDRTAVVNSPTALNIPASPVYYGGLSNDITFKDFNLSFTFQVKKQTGELYPTAAPGVLDNGNQNVYWLNRWRKAGDQSRLPGATTDNSLYSDYIGSDAGFGNNSFVKLKNVSLSYDVPPEYLKKIRLNRLRVYAQAQNLYTWTKNSYAYDPETGTSLPALRVITIGLNASL